MVKAKFHGGYVVAAFCNSISIFDIRKPSIIVNQALTEIPNRLPDMELNDFDITPTPSGLPLLAALDDSGSTHLYSIDPAQSLTYTRSL